MKPLYLLIIILTLGNCITFSSFNPEGIEEKVKADAEVAKTKKVKYRVNLSYLAMTEDGLKHYPDSSKSGTEKYERVFVHDSNSPIQVKIKYTESRYGVLATIYFFACIYMPICYIPIGSGEYFISYGQRSNLIEKRIDYKSSGVTFLPIIGWVSILFNTEYKRGESLDANLPYSLREEIAKIAPPELAVQEGDEPSTSALPVSYTDIVVLKNGEILDGVHTKVTPTTLEVTESNGKKTIYKKSQVLSVKKK